MRQTEDHPRNRQERTAAPIDLLIESQEQFLRFLERRVGSRETAKEILQQAYLIGLEKLGDLRETDSVIAWFYRVLRNAAVDHYRRAGAERRALEVEAGRTELFELPAQEIEGRICSCARPLLEEMRPSYAELLRAVDLEGASVSDLARKLGISANNARVRLHRARRDLRRRLVATCGVCAEHSCLDCSCGTGANRDHGSKKV